MLTQTIKHLRRIFRRHVHPHGRIVFSLESEWNYFIQNAQKFQQQHPDEPWILVKDSRLVGCYATHRDAMAAGYREFKLQPFLVQDVRELQWQFARINIPEIETIDLPVPPELKLQKLKHAC